MGVKTKRTMNVARRRPSMTLATFAYVIAASSTVFIVPAGAESLQDAMAVAYRTNPTVQSERARLRATGELKAQALAGLLPQISASGNLGRSVVSQSSAAGGPFDQQNVPLDQISYVAQGEQLLFDGFRSIHAVKQAADQINAAEAQLIGIEQQLLSDVASAYFDVVRDMAVYELNRSNVEVLLQQLDQAQVRFRVGEITRTDVAQADARLAGARANLTNASAQLAVSRARYVQLVGQSPASLEADTPPPLLPASLDDAKTMALQVAPAILTAKATERASKRAVKIAKGNFAPRITANADYQFAEEPSTFITETDSYTYGVRANLPIFQGGARFSQVRQAKATNESDRQRIVEAERLTTAQVVAAWEQLNAANATITSAQAQVSANTLALEGVRKEALVGSRSTLDVLNAELELLNAEVALATAQRDSRGASYALLAAMGVLTPEAMGLTAYDAPKKGGFLPF
ncbi:MAG: TolC family outer membrane protein [Pseudomonadota bacterium]